MERIKKKVISIFREQSLSITGEGGSKIVDYLDVLFNLEDGSYAPFIKPNTNTKYVSTQSNHPSKIISMIQPNVCKRLSTNSSSKEMFDQHSAHFEQALVEAGHPGNIQYVEPTVPTQGRRTRQRKTIWFNPPFSKNISTNVAAKFLSLVRRHFGKDSKLYSIFNVFNLKVSYCTGPSMMDIISKHNAKVLRKNEEKDKAAPPGCNCQGGAANCPLNGRCLTKSLVYRADVRVGSDVKHYIGQTSNTFKTRWNGHKSDTRCGRARTGLNSYLIDLQRNGLVPDEVRWSKVVSSFPRKRGSKICPLCIEEKVQIAINQDKDALNDRSEMMTRCRHLDALMLSNCYKAGTTVIRNPTQIALEQPVPEQPVPVQLVPAAEEMAEDPQTIADGATATDGNDARDEYQSSRGRRTAKVSYGKFF